MTDGYSDRDLAEFLDYLSSKGLLNKNTAVSRKAAAKKMLSVLEDSETTDLRNLDLDELSTRFANIEGKRYSPDSMRVYRSRLNSSLADFFRYKENPANFKMNSTNVRKRTRISTAAAQLESLGNQADRKSTAKNPEMPSTIDIPVALRNNCIVQVNGVPIDLSAAEAKKIANVIMAQATVDEE